MCPCNVHSAVLANQWTGSVTLNRTSAAGQGSSMWSIQVCMLASTFIYIREGKRVQTLAVNILSTSPIAGCENILQAARTLSRLTYRECPFVLRRQTDSTAIPGPFQPGTCWTCVSLNKSEHLICCTGLEVFERARLTKPPVLSAP